MTLEIKGMRKSLGSFVLGPLDMIIGSGVTVLLGPNGSGKTTLLNLIAGLDIPDSGLVKLNGKSLNHIPPEKRRLGYCFQEPSLFPHLDVYSNVMFGKPLKEDADNAIKLLQVEHLRKRKIQSLSRGEKQRVSIARTLATRPEALLLDEPLAHLDLPIREQLRTDLQQVLRNLRIPVLLVTHYKDDVSCFADNLIIFENGQVVCLRSLDDLPGIPPTPFTARFLGYENVFVGKVLTSLKDFVLIRIGSHKFRGVVETQFTENKGVLVVIRPEDIKITKSRAPGENILNGMVKEVRFLESFIKVRISCDGLEMMCSVTQDEVNKLNLSPGRKMSLSFDADDITVF